MKEKKIISWLLFISMLFFIFFFSSQPGQESSNLSNGILDKIMKILPFSLNQEIFSFGIRKMAHFTCFALLGISTINLIYVYKGLDAKYIFIALFFVFFYAVSDEFHQLFVNGRNGSFIDVLIDTCGGFFGIILFKKMLVKRKMKRIKI